LNVFELCGGAVHGAIRCCAGSVGPRVLTLPAGGYLWNGGPNVQIGENSGPENTGENEDENDT